MNILSNFMRTHIGLKICHFLLSVVSITEGPENKIMRKFCIHSSVPCRDSTLEQFLFNLVSKKIEKNDFSWGLFFMAEVLFWWMYCAIAAAPKETAFLIFSCEASLTYRNLKDWQTRSELAIFTFVDTCRPPMNKLL